MTISDKASTQLHSGGTWPTKEQEMLLKASLLSGDNAIDCWSEWKNMVGVNDMDRGSIRIFPLLYRNLSPMGIAGAEINKARGCHRMAWYKNQILFDKAIKLLQKFEEAGINIIVLKGMALVLRYYKDLGLRPMDDIDFFVARKDALAAMNLLEHNGWSHTGVLNSRIPIDNYFDNHHAFGFSDRRGDNIDLHWYLMPETILSTVNDRFLQDHATVEYNGQTVAILRPTHQLFHVCAHGAKWSFIPPIRWISDASMIFHHSAAEIDWQEIVSLAGRLRITLYIRDTLFYLRDTFGIHIPEWVAEELDNSRITPFERKEYRLLTTRPLKVRRFFFVVHWYRYSRICQEKKQRGLIKRVLGFPRHIQLYLMVKSLWRLPFFFFGKSIRFLWSRMRGWFGK